MVARNSKERKSTMKLKATGILRRIDSLGRIVIPKELCKQMKIREGDPLEIFVSQDNSIVLKQYNPYGDQDWTKALHIGQALLDKPFALYDREGECRVKSANAEQLPSTLNRPDQEANCYEIADGDCVYAYLMVKVANPNSPLAAKAILAFMKDD